MRENDCVPTNVIKLIFSEDTLWKKVRQEGRRKRAGRQPDFSRFGIKRL
ncbi:MAG: hypothetical protein HFG55_05635 [Lachnospiraceae bacterium]|nr:hypothetical protein [Lachnospiraceae bacterium]